MAAQGGVGGQARAMATAAAAHKGLAETMVAQSVATVVDPMEEVAVVPVLLAAAMAMDHQAEALEGAWAAADLVATEAARVALAGRTPPSRRWQASARLPRRPTEDAK